MCVKGAPLLGLSPIPIVLCDSEGGCCASLQEVPLDHAHTPLERQCVLERVFSERVSATRLSRAGQEVLDPLLLRGECGRSTANSCEHLSAPIVMSDRDHGLHDTCMQAPAYYNTEHENRINGGAEDTQDERALNNYDITLISAGLILRHHR